MYQLITTSDGSHTLYVPELNEHFHSINGAVQESDHIFIRNGFDYCNADPLHIFEAGFGTGLNALLTAIRSMTGKREVFYTAVEKYPLENKIIESLNHYSFAGKNGKSIYRQIHSAEWDSMNKICRNFSLRKIKGDLTKDQLTGSYDLIYFDAFGPDKQPEMWNTGIFEKISSITVSGGILVTYSSKGEIRRNLQAAGFEVKRLPGPPGKHHIVRAIKI